MNIPGASVDPAQLPDGSTADIFVAESLSRRRCASDDPALDRLDAGRACAKRGGGSRWRSTAPRIRPNAPRPVERSGASRMRATVTRAASSSPATTPPTPRWRSTTTWVTDWVAHLGSAVRWFALDNEPMLWSETHFDVHPSPVSYDEMWARTADIGSAVKAARPDAMIFGPVVWGWCAYFYSAADGCCPGADRLPTAAGPFSSGISIRSASTNMNTGVRPVDVLDIHYYPQGGQALTGEGEREPPGPASALGEGPLRPDLCNPSRGSVSRCVWCRGCANSSTSDVPGSASPSPSTTGARMGSRRPWPRPRCWRFSGAKGVFAAMRWVVPDVGSRMEDAFQAFSGLRRHRGPGHRYQPYLLSVRTSTRSAPTRWSHRPAISCCSCSTRTLRPRMSV